MNSFIHYHVGLRKVVPLTTGGAVDFDMCMEVVRNLSGCQHCPFMCSFKLTGSYASSCNVNVGGFSKQVTCSTTQYPTTGYRNSYTAKMYPVTQVVQNCM